MAKTSHHKAVKSDKQEKEANKSKKKPKRDGVPRPKEHLEQIPYRLREIMKSKEKMKMGSKKLKKVSRTANFKAPTETCDQEEIPVPHFRQGKMESVKAYMKRMEQETQHVLFLTKNQSDRRPELQMDEKEAKPGKQKSEKKKLFDKGRLQRLHLKKAQREEERTEKEMFVDDIQFGEIAMEPPSLTAKPKKAPAKSQAAPKDLLLTSLYGQPAAVSTAKPSFAKQRILEEERERVVQAYRQLKKQKQEEQERQKSRIGKLQNPQ